MRIILLGAPGAGKGTQAALLSKETGLVHIASGDLFRQAQEGGSELGALARSYMERGTLVPDEVTVRMILERIAEPNSARGFLLDGFPRTLGQAQALEEALAQEGKAIDKILYIKVSQAELLRRLGGRFICRRCQAPYSDTLPPKVPGRCDRCGGELYQRPDDAQGTARKRLEVYFTETLPLIEYYRRASKLVEIDGKQSVEEVRRDLLAALAAEEVANPAGIVIKSPEEIQIMSRAGKVVAATLETLRRETRPGVSTGYLETVAARELKKRGALSAFKGYRGFPATLCISVNEEVVHGIPGERVLREGDIVALDVGAIVGGFHADAAVTVAVGRISPQARALIEATEGALGRGIAAARAGARLGDVSAAIQNYVESQGFSVVREYVGHGIGREMHEEPQVPNFGVPGQGPLLQKGITLALEPMVNAGGWRTRVAPNQWTVLTADGSLSAHFEHTIAITDTEAEVLTQP